MKKNYTIVITFIFLLVSNLMFSQETTAKYIGYVEVGAQKAITSKNNNITGFHGAYNSVIKGKYVIGLNVVGAFEKKYLKRLESNHINNYTGYYANFGYRNNIGKNLYLTPSIGVGQINYVLTDYKGETTGRLTGDLFSGFTTVFETKYDLITDNQIVVPVNLNLLYTGKYAGIGLNLYFIGGKYTEMGAGVSFNFGKVR